MPVKYPKVAVLLAAYNGMRWIEEQLESILRQSGVDLTVYISIDPSNDGTKGWCSAFSAKYPQVKLLPDAGPFGGAARNFFRLIRDVALDDYDFVAFSDQDDVWHSDKLRRSIDVLRGRGVDAYSSNVTAFWPDGKKMLLDKAQDQVAWDFLFEAAGPGCTYVFSKKLFTALKAKLLEKWVGLQSVSLHDWYFYAFARSHGYSWYIDPVPTMNYRQHDNNQVGANTGVDQLFARLKKIRSGWWFSQVRLITELVGLENHPFVRKWLLLRRPHLLILSLSASQCRRRLRDKFYFFFVCCITAVIGTGLK